MSLPAGLRGVVVRCGTRADRVRYGPVPRGPVGGEFDAGKRTATRTPATWPDAIALSAARFRELSRPAAWRGDEKMKARPAPHFPKSTPLPAMCDRLIAGCLSADFSIGDCRRFPATS
jgi:hypothetical protein